MRQEVLQIMPARLRNAVEQCAGNRTDLEEIRIRVGQAPEFRFKEKSRWLPFTVTEADIEEMLTFISRYSIYAYEEEIRQGFLTIEGGCRIGFAGQVRLLDGQVDRMTNIRFLNIRIAGERRGCAKEIVPWLYEEGVFCNTLFVSLPGVGKTTYLRDCIRMISDGDGKRAGKKICIIDERSEIASSHLGVPQNDVGCRTDVLDGCPKRAGMRMALRSMSPEIIAVDELGGREDADAVEEMILSGCGVLGTMHGNRMEDISKMPMMLEMRRKNLFQRYIFLKKKETGERFFAVYDGECRKLC